MSRMCVEVGFIRGVMVRRDAEDKMFRVFASTDRFRDNILIGEWESLEDALGVFAEWCDRINGQGGEE